MSSKDIEGYPQGYLGDCPGSQKPAIIKRKSLYKLGLLVLGPNGRSRKYNYYQARNMRNDSFMDLQNKKTVLFIGGFMDSPHFFVSQVMGKAYYKLGYNVLLLEANKFLTVHYPISARYLNPVGKHIAEMLTNLTAAGMPVDNFELAGVSLGAQSVSFVAKHFYNITGEKVHKITVLDPSGPCFRNRGPEGRIDESDGKLVVAINTNIDGFGMAAPIAHVSFYVNGGEYQPGDIYWMPCSIMCSHVRAYVLWFTALQNPNKFIGLKCDSVQQARRHQCYDRKPLETNVLDNVNLNASNPGIFYLATTSEFPYYMGEEGLKKENEFWTKNLNAMNAPDLIKMRK